MDVKLFFKLTKFGWINLFYAPILSFCIYVFLNKGNCIPLLLISFILSLSYFIFTYKRKIRKGVDFLILSPLIFLFIASLIMVFSLYFNFSYDLLIKTVLIIGAFYGLSFSYSNFSTYKEMKNDYFRIDTMMKKRYNCNIIYNLENGSPCEQSIANDFRKKYAKAK